VALKGLLRMKSCRLLCCPSTFTTVYILADQGVHPGTIFAFWTGVQQTPTPGAGSIPQEVLDLRAALDQIAAGAPVLVAFDYEPGAAPEMEAAAMGVIDQLILKGSVIRVVSTTVTGPALARRMLKGVEYARRSRHTTGYRRAISWRGCGLRAFSRDPAGDAP
jgi:hypothetical protein